MAQESKRKQPERQIGNLELNKETLAELTELEAEDVEGGGIRLSVDCGGSRCSGKDTGCA